MLTNIQHVAVFLVLIIADVSENVYCIFSLYHRLRLSRKIVPLDEDCDESKQNTNTLTKRTSSVYKLIETLDKKRDKGTILFIAATLLQRESGEIFNPFCYPDLAGSTLVPLPAFCKTGAF